MPSKRVKCPLCSGPMVPHATRCGKCYWAEMQRTSTVRMARAGVSTKPHTKPGDGLMLRPVYRIDVLNLKAVREIGDGAEEARPHLGGHLRKPPPFRWAWRDTEGIDKPVAV